MENTLTTDINSNTSTDTDNGIPNIDLINTYKANNFKLWLREKEIIKMLSVGRTTLWHWVKTNIFPKPFKIGCCTFWKIKDVMDFVEKYQEQTGNEEPSTING